MNRSGLGKFLDKGIGIRNHQVRLQRQTRHPSQRVDDWRSHRKIGHKMSIHHVDVNAVRPGSLSLGDLIAKVSEIGGEDRRSELDCISRHVASLSLR